MNEILEYAKNNIALFDKGGVSSNETRFFDYGGRKYVLKTPLMGGDRLSPFWQMMKNVFNFTFEVQNRHMNDVCSLLKDNPHIPVPALEAADADAAVYEFIEGKAWDEDEFPKGTDNAFKLGRYIGCNHRTAHAACGILGIEDVPCIFDAAKKHMEQCITRYWNSSNEIDRQVRNRFEFLATQHFTSSKYSLIMVDNCADQFLFNGDEIKACIDLDAYVIGPVEWELTFMRLQVGDWDRFKAGYETYQPLPDIGSTAGFFRFIMALNAYRNKNEMASVLASEK